MSCIGKSSGNQSANQEAPAVQIPEEGSGDAYTTQYTNKLQINIISDNNIIGQEFWTENKQTKYWNKIHTRTNKMVWWGWDHRLHYNRTKWIHKGQAKIKMYKIKIMVQTIYINCSFPRDSTPYILPSKGEIVPPISTKMNWNTKTLSFRHQYWLIASPSIPIQKHSASEPYWLPQ